MPWLIRRAALLLCFSLGTFFWYLLTLAPARTSRLPETHASAGRPSTPPAAVPADAGPRRAREQDDPLGQTIKFGPASPVSVSVNVRTLVLREGASPSAPVVARLKMGEYESAEILEATRDFVRVKIPATDGADDGGVARERAYEGWATWRSVVPTVTAIVLDAETGALVARVPLDFDVDSVTFSPDGSKALFHESRGGTLAREVGTSDYTHARTLTSPLGENFSSPFYGPDGTFHVAAYRQGNAVDPGKVNLVSVRPDGESNQSFWGAAEEYEFLKVSGDGSKVFVARKRREGDHELRVDVFDMATRQFLNTLTLAGAELPWSADSFVLSPDGTELYVQLSGETRTIAVIDTRTGQQARELPTPGGGWFHLSQQNLVGDSLLLQTWDYDGAEATEPRAFWAGGRGAVEAARGIAYAVEAAGRRYAVNGDGTRFFQLDGETNGVKASFPVPRPELLRGGKTDAGEMTAYGLRVSPDGKRVILFVGFVHSC